MVTIIVPSCCERMQCNGSAMVSRRMVISGILTAQCDAGSGGTNPAMVVITMETTIAIGGAY